MRITFQFCGLSGKASPVTADLDIKAGSLSIEDSLSVTVDFMVGELILLL